MSSTPTANPKKPAAKAGRCRNRDQGLGNSGCHGCLQPCLLTIRQLVTLRRMHNGDSIHRKRCKRFNTPHHAHFLTFSCFGRQPFFSGDTDPRWFLEQLDNARNKVGFHIWAYVLMPEHGHLVIWPGETYSISSILWWIKRPFSHRVLTHAKQNRPEFHSRMKRQAANGRPSYHFWQPGGGYDRNLWTDDHIHEKIQYVHENPVRRGLVKRPEDWIWSSYGAWATGERGPLQLDLDSAPVFER